MTEYLMSALVLIIMTSALNELTDWAPKLAERLLCWGARRIGIPEQTARYEEEWLANLNEVPAKLSKLAMACGVVARGVPQMRRQFGGEADMLVADCEAGRRDSLELAERYQELVSASRRSSGRKGPAVLLLEAAVEGLGAEHAKELACSLLDLGLGSSASGFIWEWLRPERICDRRAGDALILFLGLAERQPSDRPQHERLIKDATSQWSYENRRELQELLRRAQ